MRPFLSRILFFACAILSNGMSFSQSLADLDSMKKVLVSNKHDTLKLLALTDLSWYYSDKDSKIAFAYAKEELRNSVKINDLKWISSAYNDIGICWYRIGQLDSALAYYNKSLDIRQSLNDKNLIASSLSKIGVLYSEIGKYDKSLETHFAALKIFKDAKNERYEAVTYNNIGQVFNRLKNHKKEIEYTEKALAIHLKNDDDYHAAQCYGNLGDIYKKLNNANKADGYQQKALAIFRKYGDRANEAAVLNNMGTLMRMQGENVKSLAHYLEAYRIAKEIDDKLSLSLYCHNISSVSIDIGKYKQAEKYALESLENLDQINKSQLFRTYRELSIIYSFLNEPKKAKKYLDLYDNTKDSVYTKESNSLVADMEVKYQSAEKDKALIIKDAEITKQQADASKKAVQRNAMLIGLLLLLGFSLFIYRSYKEKKASNIEITLQKHVIEEKQKEILDSIHYAKRIQQAMLTGEEYISKHFRAEYFILYKPKDIVAGDFYWAVSNHNKFYIATADCTGHGVPGAFMSLLNISFLNEHVNESGLTSPSEILDKQRESIINALNPKGDENSKDGMDCVLCAYEFPENEHSNEKVKLSFAAANNPLWLVRNGVLNEYKGDKMPVGKYLDGLGNFSLQELELEKGDMIYTSTDGFPDQFGGENNKKLTKKHFKAELEKISHLPMNDQKQHLSNFIQHWMGKSKQIDDILVIGVRV